MKFFFTLQKIKSEKFMSAVKNGVLNLSTGRFRFYQDLRKYMVSKNLSQVPGTERKEWKCSFPYLFSRKL